MRKDSSADGLRGVASLGVVFHHALLAFSPVSMIGFFPSVAFPDAPDGMLDRLASLPILSTLWNGRLAVCIFFVLSGYVLTAKFVRDSHDEQVRNQAARRYLRLGIPIFASAIFACLLWSLGTYHIDQAAYISRSAWLGSLRPIGLGWIDAIREGVYGAMLGGQARVNPVLWTMHIEFFGSMLIFAYCLLGKGWVYLSAAMFVAIVYFAAPREWPYYSAFLIGFFIARSEAPESKVIPSISVAIGLLVAHIPSGAGMWYFLPVGFNDDIRFMIASVFGGAFIVYGVRFGALRSLLHSRPAQFLGRVSFPLYLIHLPILLSLGCWTFMALTDHGYGRISSAAAAFACVLAASMLVASFFERLIDAPAIAWSKTMFRRNEVVSLSRDDAATAASK